MKESMNGPAQKPAAAKPDPKKSKRAMMAAMLASKGKK